MRHHFEDSCNMNVLNWKLYQKNKFIRTWSSRKVEFLSENTFEYVNHFQFKDFHVHFMTLQSAGFKFFAEIMRGSCVFCCSSCISFNTRSHLKCYLINLINWLKNIPHAYLETLSPTAFFTDIYRLVTLTSINEWLLLFINISSKLSTTND